MIAYLEYLSAPTKVGLAVIGCFAVMQLVGELLEFKGKIVPEALKIRKYFARKKTERQETSATLKAVKQLLGDVNEHYSADNIEKRNSWMGWVNARAEVYDDSIVEINKTLSTVAEALNSNTKMTEEMFVQSSRDRIIDFATRVSDNHAAASREEFNRIFKVHKKYEIFLSEHDMTNGEVDIAFQIIKEAYEYRLKNHTFIEDLRGYSRAAE